MTLLAVDENRRVADEAVAQLIERLEMAFMPAPAIDDPDLRWFSYMRLPLSAFLEGIFACRQELGPGPHRLLEVGSGLGTNLCLASMLGWRPEGIEIFEGYAVQSRRLFPFCPVTVADATSFERYSEFDVVYCYRIATHFQEQDEINRMIASNMRSGSLFWSASYQGPYPEWLEHVAGLVWRVP